MRAFTLIELLIIIAIIAIIGILSSIVLASVNEVQRDSGKPKCSTYADTKLSEVPARCINERGGYKDY